MTQPFNHIRHYRWRRLGHGASFGYARRAGREALLWSARAGTCRRHQRQAHQSAFFFPAKSRSRSQRLKATGALGDLGAACDALLLVVPAQHTRETCRQIAQLPGDAPIVVCAKGIEQKTGKLLGEIVGEELPRRKLAALSGPSFAIEVARDMPTALTLAAKDKNLGTDLMQALGTRHFRLYLTDDVTGAQIGGAVKNVLAVACGIAAGCRLGDNTRAALITRGLAEIVRLGNGNGCAAGNPGGAYRASAIWCSLVRACSRATCRSAWRWGRARSSPIFSPSAPAVTEGVYTQLPPPARALAQRYNVEMPIVEAVDAVPLTAWGGARADHRGPLWRGPLKPNARHLCPRKLLALAPVCRKTFQLMRAWRNW